VAQPLFGGPIVVIAIMSSKSPSSNTGRSPSSRRESLKLPFVVAVLASCSYIIAADQKSGEWSFLQLLSEPFSWQRFFLASAVVTMLTDVKRWLWIFAHTIGRDLKFLYRISNLVLNTISAKVWNLTVGEVLEATACKFPEKTMIIFTGEGAAATKRMTFREVNEHTNQVAHFFEARSYGKGDVMALCAENRHDYMSLWLGMSKLGSVTALINTYITDTSLVHTLDTVKAKGVMFTSETEKNIAEIMDELPADFEFYKIDPATVSPDFPRLSSRTVNVVEGISRCPTTPVEGKRSGVSDFVVFIFTSGTTGLPKAVPLKNSRYLLMGGGLDMCGLSRSDVVYTTLPLYHTAANGLVMGGSICNGLTVVLRKKFSASNYWKDCCEHNVTAAQYIGEVARYLCRKDPEGPNGHHEKSHKVRVMFGNGLRPQIWKEVVDRFGVDIVEFYGATEGNCTIVNFSNKLGAVGFISRIFPWLIPSRVVRVNPDTGEFIRDPKTGLCILCRPGEPGELVAQIDARNPVRDFSGYADKRSTAKKVVRDVLKKGDACFRSGDILQTDDLGFVYFVDRCGDTFRWKAENVSTLEVEGLLAPIVGYRDVIVYGVEIPNTDGRAGMAAIGGVAPGSIDFDDMYAKVCEKLPFYARPLFIRVGSELEVTATLKLKKVNLQKESYHFKTFTDEVYFLDNSAKTYRRLDEDVYRQIEQGAWTF